MKEVQANIFLFGDYLKDHFSTFQWNSTIIDDLQALQYDGERESTCQAFQVSAALCEMALNSTTAFQFTSVE